jgi:hypothetical protein
MSHRDKKVKRRMRNLNEHIKDLEAKFTQMDSEPIDQSLLSFLNDDDQDEHDHDNDQFDGDNDDSDLMDLDPSDRPQPDEDQNRHREPKSRSPYQGGSSNYRYQAPYASPEREENNLNSYLTNCNITSNRTDETSVDASKGRESGSSLYRNQFSNYRNYASTSRINTCPKFDSGRKEVVHSEESQLIREKELSDQNLNSITRI